MSTPNGGQAAVDAVTAIFKAFVADVVRVIGDITSGAVNGQVNVADLQAVADSAQQAQAQLDQLDPAAPSQPTS